MIKNDFTNGVDTDYIKNIELDDIYYNLFCRRIKKYCTKKRVRRNGTQIMMHYLKPQYVNPERYCDYCTFKTYDENHEEAFNEETINDEAFHETNEISKYADISTQTDPIITKLKNLLSLL